MTQSAANLASTCRIRATMARRTPIAARSGVGVLFVLCVPLAAGIATVRGVSIGGFNYTGWLWVFFLAFGVLAILATKALDRGQTIAFPYRPWLVWFGFVGLSLVWCRNPGGRNVQDFFQISMPLVVAIAASMFIRTEVQLRLLLRMFGVAVLLIFLFIVAARLGLTGGLNVESTPRPMGLTIALAACIFIAGWPHRLAVPLLLWGTCLLVVMMTTGRMATLVVLLLPLMHPLLGGWRWRLTALLVMAALGIAVFYTPAFQQQFFYAGQGTLTELFQGQIRGSGRFEAWPPIWAEATRDPILGHGVGTTYAFVPQVWSEMNHVHNDYLRIFFELGIVGVVLFLVVAIWQLVDLKKQMARATGITKLAFVAAFLGMCTFLVTSTTGNTLIYNLWFMNPLMALLGAAYGAAYGAARGTSTTDASEHLSADAVSPRERPHGLIPHHP